MRLIATLVLALASFAGAEASLLDLGSMIQPAPLDARFADPKWHIWCGAPIQGPDGKYHLYYSRWPIEDGFAPGWAIHSEIAYAVADKPLGTSRAPNFPYRTLADQARVDGLMEL